MTKPRRRLIAVHTWADVPHFESEAEEADFWATHELGKELLAQMRNDADTGLPPPRPRTKPIAIRFDEDTLRRMKALASKRGKGYQTLLKEFVSERLYEEEKREGVI
jgi:predicted DNA binding CopG/RHH family protein